MKKLLLLALMLSINLALASDLTKNKYGKITTIRTIKLSNINSNDIIMLENEISDHNVNFVIDILNTTENGKTMYVVIDSPGGSVFSGLKLINAMKSFKRDRKLKIKCVITGSAYSMAAIIAMYCSETYMLKTGSMMFHEASYVAKGSAAEIRDIVAFTERFLAVIENNLAEQMGMSYEEYVDFRKSEVWLTSYDAANLGLVDALIDSFDFYEAKKPTQQDMLSIIIGRLE